VTDSTALIDLAGTLDKALQQGSDAYFQMFNQPSTTSGKIPRNHFCSWDLKLNPESVYTLVITREFYPVLEQISLKIFGRNKEEYVTDVEL